jgi:5-dehydro-2-deoxygluconokinase
MCSSQIFWTTGTGLSAQPSRDTTLGAMREYRRRHPSGECIHDLDWRPMLWADAERADASRWAKEAAAMATVVLGNLHEVDMALGTGQDHRAAATGLLDQGVRIAVIKLGERGVYARSAAGDEVMAPPVPVTVVCGGGAGDAFGGAFCHGLLSGWGLEQIMRFANGAGAIVASQLACSDAMPTVAEVESILDRTNAVVMPQLEQAP